MSSAAPGLAEVSAATAQHLQQSWTGIYWRALFTVPELSSSHTLLPQGTSVGQVTSLQLEQPCRPKLVYQTSVKSLHSQLPALRLGSPATNLPLDTCIWAAEVLGLIYQLARFPVAGQRDFNTSNSCMVPTLQKWGSPPDRSLQLLPQGSCSENMVAKGQNLSA